MKMFGIYQKMDLLKFTVRRDQYISAYWCHKIPTTCSWQREVTTLSQPEGHALHASETERKKMEE